MGEEKIPAPHPGEILLEDYLRPMGISQNQLARSMRVPANRIHAIIHGRRAITAETALGLGRRWVLRLSCGWAYRWNTI